MPPFLTLLRVATDDTSLGGWSRNSSYDPVHSCRLPSMSKASEFHDVMSRSDAPSRGDSFPAMPSPTTRLTQHHAHPLSFPLHPIDSEGHNIDERRSLPPHHHHAITILSFAFRKPCRRYPAAACFPSLNLFTSWIPKLDIHFLVRAQKRPWGSKIVSN